MNEQDRLREEIKILKSEIKIKQSLVSEKERLIKQLEFETISWNELEKLVISLNNNDTHNNPVVYSLDYYQSFTTRIIEHEGKRALKVGNYFHNDRTPRGEDVKIFKDRRSYKNHYFD